MRVLITGNRGQLGLALQHALTQHEVTGFDLPEVDITEIESCRSAIQEAAPNVVIHCAAYTDVDGCARDPQLAYRVNAQGTRNVAQACRDVGARLVHISTNEVFAGDITTGYEEWRPLDPRNPYGRTKAAAETHVRALLTDYYIIRTAWLFAPGGRNFIHAILRRAHEHGQVRVVTDEVGNPTNVDDLAGAISRLIETERFGTYHFTNAGACSRWQFAQEILRQSKLADSVTNVPILSMGFQRPSSPPPFGALLNLNGAALGIELRPWQEALAAYLEAEGDVS